MFKFYIYFLAFLVHCSFNCCIKNKDKELIDPDILKIYLYNISSIRDLEKFGISLLIKTSVIKTNTFNNQSIKTSIATPGRCDPKLKCITNPLTVKITKPSQLVYPPCINIYRCDGCCNYNEKCMPTKIEKVLLTNIGILQIVDNYVTYDDSIKVSIYNHTNCECDCQWHTDQDCKKVNINYIKSPTSCKCVCPNPVTKCGSFHEFEEITCSCVCNKKIYSKIESTCKSRQLKWNNSTCKCEA